MGGWVVYGGGKFPLRLKPVLLRNLGTFRLLKGAEQINLVVLIGA